MEGWILGVPGFILAGKERNGPGNQPRHGGNFGRLKEAWSDEHTRWSKCDLWAKRYVYFWVDGIHVQARLEEAAQCDAVVKHNVAPANSPCMPIAAAR